MVILKFPFGCMSETNVAEENSNVIKLQIMCSTRDNCPIPGAYKAKTTRKYPDTGWFIDINREDIFDFVEQYDHWLLGKNPQGEYWLKIN